MRTLKWIGFFIVCFGPAVYLMAASEIDIDTDMNNSAAAAKPSPTVYPPMVEMTATPVPTEVTQAAPPPIPMEAHGVLKMKDVYQAGISYYQHQDFGKAIRFLKKSLQVQDPYTRKYYYAEANAMLGVIYQFHIIDKKLAYQYYRAALKIDPKTKTARKHIREVSNADGSN